MQNFYIRRLKYSPNLFIGMELDKNNIALTSKDELANLCDRLTLHDFFIQQMYNKIFV